MATIKINGGKPLSGSIAIESNKNAVLPIIAATLLTKEKCIIHRIPFSPDVLKMLRALEMMGAQVTKFMECQKVEITCKDISTHVVPDVVQGMQASILFVGPLLARFGKVQVPKNMGCKLGFRGHEGHIEYLKPFGVSSDMGDGSLFFTKTKNLFDEVLVQKSDHSKGVMFEYFTQPLVTPTENLLMFLSTATSYDFHLSGLAQETHVLQLIEVLKKMGVSINGAGGMFSVTGSYRELKGFEIAIEPDHVDYYGTVVSALVTKSQIEIGFDGTWLENEHVGICRMNKFLSDVGVSVTCSGILYRTNISGFTPQNYFPRSGEYTWKLDPGPWPAFPVDCLPSFIVLACMNKNPDMEVVVSNWMYEDGMRYASVLKDMGAHITIENPQKIRIRGSKNPFHTMPINVTAPDVIEGARAIFIAALARPGETTIRNIDPLLRRSPQFIKKYQQLGADIEIIKE